MKLPTCPVLLSVEMECSPRGSSSRLQVQEIAHRLADGLQPDKVFQGTEYLATIKAELRKVMKQRFVCTTCCLEQTN